MSCFTEPGASTALVFQIPRQRVAALVDSWATAAQQQACRNAMVASTALARTRAQRIVVEEFLAARLGIRDANPEHGEVAVQEQA